jgi:ABC-type sugar transport system ATPase subunit
MMVGRSIDRLYPAKQGKDGDVILELQDVSYRSAVHNISLRLKRGEILGLAGLVGSGRTETALTIFGITPATGGQILIDGKPVTIASPEAARDLGIAYVPEDRGHQGLIRTQTIEREHRTRQPEAADARLLRRCGARHGGGEDRHHRFGIGQGDPNSRCASSRAATSRRWCSANGSPPIRASSSWMSRRAGSMSAPRRKYTC